jgi:hypothetical protein
MNRMKRLLSVVIPCVVLLGVVPEMSIAANPKIYIPDPVQIPCTLTTQKIRSVVRTAVLDRGWIPADKGEGVIEAKLDKDKYVVFVTLTFDAKAVRIAYKSSVNLDYQGTGAEATIKRGYNAWVKNLEKDVAIALSRSCG